MSNHRKEHVSISGGWKVLWDTCQVFWTWNRWWLIPLAVLIAMIAVFYMRSA